MTPKAFSGPTTAVANDVHDKSICRSRGFQQVWPNG